MGDTPMTAPFKSPQTFLLVDGDEAGRQRLGRALERRAFQVSHAATCAEAITLIADRRHDFSVFDLRLADGTGFDLLEMMRRESPWTRSLILTECGDISTAVQAARLGVVDYLLKPAEAEDVVAALLTPAGERPPPPASPRSGERVRWDHIQKVFHDCHENVSQTARRLNMHRRTLQRIMAKHEPT